MKNKNINKIISLIEIVLGLFMIFIEISDFIRLPSVNDYTWNLELIKYKEFTYSRILMYIILFCAGISFFINQKLYSLFTISFMLNIYLKYLVDFSLTISGNNPITVYSLPTLATLICIILIIFFFRDKSFIGIKITNKTIYCSILISIAWSIFYASIEYYGLFLIS